MAYGMCVYKDVACVCIIVVTVGDQPCATGVFLAGPIYNADIKIS